MATPWQTSTSAALLVVAIFGLYEWFGRSDTPVKSASLTAPASSSPAGAAAPFTAAAKMFGSAAGVDDLRAGASGDPARSGKKSNASSMDTAIANLEARLAKGGGSAGDWELLAKSFEFLSRPADAAEARAHRLPTSTQDTPGDTPTGVAVSGEVALDAALSGKAAAGETLFIVAKSVDSPGIPVAVYRGTVGSWPVKFSLDDSQSIMPGRTLSSAGRVTIEARISRKGQPLPAPGDLQGSSGVINPADHKPLQITIDHVIS
jgi:hypothetical protein